MDKKENIHYNPARSARLNWELFHVCRIEGSDDTIPCGNEIVRGPRNKSPRTDGMSTNTRKDLKRQKRLQTRPIQVN